MFFPYCFYSGYCLFFSDYLLPLGLSLCRLSLCRKLQTGGKGTYFFPMAATIIGIFACWLNIWHDFLGFAGSEGSLCRAARPSRGFVC